MNTNTKSIAIVAVVILVIAGAAFALTRDSNEDNEDNTITITQNDGEEVIVEIPVTKVCVVNTNAAEFLSLVGLDDKVVGVSTSMRTKPVEPWWADRTDIGSISGLNGEAILETGAKVVIGQCSSMAIKNVEALQAQGITVISLDCFGYDTQVNDLKQLVSIFEDDEATALVDKYETFFNKIVDTLKTASSEILTEDRRTFFSTMGMRENSTYYTGASELSLMLDEVCGMNNIIVEIDSSLSSSALVISEEKIVEYYEENGIDLFILRNSTPYSAGASNVNSFLTTHPMINDSGMFDHINVIKTTDSKVFSGPRCFIGMVHISEYMYPALDIDGLTVDDVVTEYNELFGKTWSSEELFYVYN